MSEPLPFEAIEPPSDCLSGRRVSLAALDELPPEEATSVAAHLATCARCSARVAAERQAIARVADEPLPSFVREGGIAAWPDILDGLALSGHFLMRDLLTDRSAPVAEARDRLVERLRRAAGRA